jgi:membrane-associated protein
METAFEYFLHLDQHLARFADLYGPWIYGLLFAIVFAETGFIVTPFLPGDSLLFATGALAATGALDVTTAGLLLLVAAIAGDAVNYSTGRAVGTRVIQLSRTDPRWGRWVNPAYVTAAQQFFGRHGGKAIVLGRFMPLVRTFVPFVAGAAEMAYPAFALFNVAGAVAWVGICLGGGYLFGNVPVVEDNFPAVAAGIVVVSLLPMVVEYVRHRRGPDLGRVETAD